MLRSSGPRALGLLAIGVAAVTGTIAWLHPRVADISFTEPIDRVPVLAVPMGMLRFSQDMDQRVGRIRVTSEEGDDWWEDQPGWLWIDERTIELLPSSETADHADLALRPDASYSLQVEDFISRDGRRLIGRKTWDFRTRPAAVQSVDDALEVGRVHGFKMPFVSELSSWRKQRYWILAEVNGGVVRCMRLSVDGTRWSRTWRLPGGHGPVSLALVMDVGGTPEVRERFERAFETRRMEVLEAWGSAGMPEELIQVKRYRGACDLSPIATADSYRALRELRRCPSFDEHDVGVLVRYERGSVTTFETIPGVFIYCVSDDAGVAGTADPEMDGRWFAETVFAHEVLHVFGWHHDWGWWSCARRPDWWQCDLAGAAPFMRYVAASRGVGTDAGTLAGEPDMATTTSPEAARTRAVP